MLSYTNKEVYNTLLHYPTVLNNEKKQLYKVKEVLDEISEDLVFYMLSEGVPKNRINNTLSYIFSKNYDSFNINRIYEGRKTIFRNLKNRCSCCGAEDNLQIHHIKKSEFYPELTYNPNNWAVLCSNCHKELHSKEHKVKELIL